MNGLNLPNERHKVDDWEKKSQVSTICCLQEIHFSSINKNKLKLQGWKLILQKAKQNEYSYTGSQETPGVTGKFGLGMRNEAGQRLIEFCQENALVIANTLFQQHKRRLYTHGHHQMVNTEIRLIIFFAAKDGEALYSQQKQDWELTVAQTMNSLLSNSDLN